MVYNNKAGDEALIFFKTKDGAKLKNKAQKEELAEAGDMVYNNKAGDMAFDFFKTKVMMCTENMFEAELQEMSSALRVNRLAEDNTAEQAGLEEQFSYQKSGGNLKKKTEAKKEEPEEAGDMVANNKAQDMAFKFFKTKVLLCTKNKFDAEIDTSAETESEGEQRQDFGRLNYSNAVRCNAKMLR